MEMRGNTGKVGMNWDSKKSGTYSGTYYKLDQLSFRLVDASWRNGRCVHSCKI